MLFDPEKLYPFEPKGECNTADDVILDRVRANIRRQLPQVQPFAQNGQTALLVCGGPSLDEKELVEAYWDGGKVVAVNGAYRWCIDRNIKPSAFIMLDGREFNTRFVDPPVAGCKYLLASQCHPDAFDKCEGREVWIWHACSAGDKEYEILKEFYFERTFPQVIGTTIGIRAIQILTMLGWSRIDVFGLDSCWLGDKHHAYDQPENEEKRIKVWLRPEGRDDKAQMFECAPWHVRQAKDFQQLVKARGGTFDLNIRGDGLIAAIVKTGAEIQTED